MKIAKVTLKFRLRYHLCLLKFKLLDVVSEEKAMKYYYKWTKDINENDSKYFKVISKR